MDRSNKDPQGYLIRFDGPATDWPCEARHFLIMYVIFNRKCRTCLFFLQFHKEMVMK